MAQQASDFDFEYWADLAARDPAAFFAARCRAIESFIASAPTAHQASLRNLQRHIDSTRAQAGTPQRAIIQLMGMLEDQLSAMRSHLLQLRDESAALASHAGARR
ncbi:MAG: DUF3135 domain-containing protein [Rhodocyclaceae bacterium]